MSILLSQPALEALARTPLAALAAPQASYHSESNKLIDALVHLYSAEDYLSPFSEMLPSDVILRYPNIPLRVAIELIQLATMKDLEFRFESPEGLLKANPLPLAWMKVGTSGLSDFANFGFPSERAFATALAVHLL